MNSPCLGPPKQAVDQGDQGETEGDSRYVHDEVTVVRGSSGHGALVQLIVEPDEYPGQHEESRGGFTARPLPAKAQEEAERAIHPEVEKFVVGLPIPIDYDTVPGATAEPEYEGGPERGWRIREPPHSQHPDGPRPRRRLRALVGWRS